MTEFNWYSLMPMLPELFLAVCGLLFLVIGAFRGNGSTSLICWLTVGAFGVACLFLLGLDTGRVSVMNDMFVLDRFTGYMKLLLLIGMAASMALSVGYLYQEGIARFEYPILLIFSAVGMMLMVSSNNMLSMYVGLELQSLSLYVLAAFRRDNARSSEAGIKYFILGALASGIMLFGISLLYGLTGTVSFAGIDSALQNAASPPLGVIFGLVFVLAGLAFKLSAAPFHMWTPDVYEGAPTSVTALFAIVPKVAALALLMRLLFEPFGSIIGEWQSIIWFLAVASMVIASFAALVQSNIKRLMAYSAIGNVGYALIGIAAGTEAGAGAVVVYISIYMIMTIGVFAVILAMRRNELPAEKIEDLAGLSRTNPALAYGMAILMFSLSGIPPLAGFIGKLVIFQAAVEAGMIGLAVIGVLMSVVAAYYYLRIVKVMFFDDAADPFDRQAAMTKRVLLTLSVLFVTLFIFKPNILIETGRASASVMFGLE